MLHLQKLGIRGIRSFDPEDFQEIKFRPLTLILGQNGAGKTTIIESLKFAATGELPPGCDRGKTFVHDIGLTNESTINGQIKLAFKDVEDKNTVITRSIRTSSRKVKQKQTVTFKQVNQVILRDGKSVDQKCCDINSEAVELFGVSKAVLNNVIFCHQEDTNWPLSEGKVLKEKFDSIFGSDDYVKSLEKIKKIRTEMVKNLKHATVQTENAREWMKETKRLEKEYSSEKARVQELRSRAAKYKEELKEQKIKLEELTKKEEIIDGHMKDILKIKYSSEALRHRIKELESFKLDEELLSKDCETISALVDSYHQQNEILMETKKKLDTELEALMDRNTELSHERKTLAQELGKIDELKRQIDIKRKNRNEIFVSIKNFSNDSLLEKQVFTEDEKKYVEDSVKDQFREYKDAHDSEKANLQVKFDDIDDKLRKAQTRKSVLYHQIQEKEKLLKSLETKLSSLGSVSQNEQESELQEELNDLSKKIDDYKAELVKLESDAVELKNNRIKFEKQKKAKLSDISVIESRISTLESKLEANNEAFMRKSIDNKISQKLSIREKCSALPELEADNEGLLFQNLKNLMDSCEKDIQSYQSSIDQNTKERSDALKSMNSYYDLMDKLTEIKSSFVGVCDIDEYEKLKESKECAMKELYARREYLGTIIPALEKQLDQIKCGGYCPVCENDIDSTWTSKKTGNTMKHEFVIENLTKTIQNNKKELASFTSTDTLEAEIRRLKKLGPIFDRYQSTKTQFEESKEAMDTFKEKISKCKDAIQKDNESIAKIKKRVDQLEAFRFDVQLHDSLCAEIKSLETQFKTLDSSKYLKELECAKDELSEMQVLLKFIQSENERFSTELEANSDQKSSIFKQLQEIEKKQRSLKHSQECQSSYRQTVTQINQLKTELVVLNNEHDELCKNIPEELSKSEELKKQIDKLNFDFQNEQLKIRNSLKTFQKYCNEIEECNERLRICYEKNSKSYIDSLESDIRDVESKIVESEKRLKNIKDELESSSPRLEMMIRCRDLLNCRKEETEYETRIAEIQGKMPKESLSQVRNAKLSMSEVRSKTQAKLENTSTQVLESQGRAETLRERLEEDKFANAKRNYKKLIAEETLMKIGCDDLNKYYKAMDSSITQFHITKMNEINKLLAKLWTIAYQGNDIEAIKIVSDEEIRSADSARRNYDYRVVMIRNGTELDMRGRCSAGQKVLASLVIRLVLAIIFCKTFTVVTLDEPTTNLDRKNIRAFARAISSLMKSNRFFQIIIITHDKEFLESLNTESIDEYFEVSKNEYGYSKIQLKSTRGDFSQLENTVKNANTTE